MTRLIREATSPAGHRVTLSIEQNTYRGAQSFYQVARRRRSGKGMQQVRYVPVIYGVVDERHPTATEQRRAEAKAHALALFEAFTRDITEPAALASASLSMPRSGGARKRRWRSRVILGVNRAS